MALKAANDNSMSNITALPSGVSAKSMILLATETASSSDAISFTSNIDDTYKEYIFKFYDIHPETNDANFQVNFRDGGSSYDATKTTTFFRAYHTEAGSSGLEYRTANDLAQGTGVATLNIGTGNENDECLAGTLQLFAPSSTTFVKHFIADTNLYEGGDNSHRALVGGYCNVTAAIDGVQFSFSADSIQSGTIKMYGVL